MIPILYESTETAFNTNGIGRLRDCIEAACVEERNGVFELDFKYPTTGQNYEQIKLGRIVAVEHDDTGDLQPFDIVSCTRGIDGTVEFHCVHISYRLSKHVATLKNVYSLASAFTQIGTAWPPMPFTFSSNMPDAAGYMAAGDNTPRTVRELLGGVEGSILDTYGGEYEWNRFNVKLWNSRGTDRDLIIRYGVDMVDYSEDVDCSETYSAVLPFWSGNEQIVISNNVVRSGSLPPSGREECVPLDLSDKFENAPTKAQLATEAAAYLGKTNPTLPVQTITVDFVRLSDSPEYEQYKGLYQCQLCDTIKVVFPKYDMSGRFKIVKTTYDVLLERYTELELGTLSASLSEALGVSNGLGGSMPSVEDYVTEYGASGDWTYRKWNSGVAECWRTISDNRPSTAFSATGSMYYRNVTGISFPSNLFTARPKVVVNADFGNVGSASANSVSATDFAITELSAVSTARAVTLDVYAVGSWR